MIKPAHPLLRRLQAELKYTVHPGPTTLGYEFYYINLSSWKLRLSEKTPVVVIKSSDLEAYSGQQLADSLRDVIRQHHLRRDPLIALVDGNGDSIREHTDSLQDRVRIVVIGAEKQLELLRSRRLSGALRDTISEQLSISLLAPYETAAPVIGSRFFGREYEISRIIENPDTNHIILGIRRIGKTSLLKEIERRLYESDEDAPAHSVIYLDCSDLFSTDDYIREVVRKLNPRELPRLHLQPFAFFFPDFLERMSKRNRRKIIFLLDEIDNLILMQRGLWDLFRMLRSSSNKGFCQYIMAGFREAMIEKNSIDSPLFNMAQEVRLNEFKRKQAQDMIVIPMENLGVHFRDKDELISQIYEETAGHPNLIQYYCTILLRLLDLSHPGKREISLDSLVDVYHDEGFKDYLLSSFMQNTENREQALVYALLLDQHLEGLTSFTQDAMDKALSQQGIQLRQSQINEACSVLKLAGVFYQHGRDYFFTSPVFTKILQQNHDLNYLLRKAKEESI